MGIVRALHPIEWFEVGDVLGDHQKSRYGRFGWWEIDEFGHCRLDNDGQALSRVRTVLEERVDTGY